MERRCAPRSFSNAAVLICPLGIAGTPHCYRAVPNSRAANASALECTRRWRRLSSSSYCLSIPRTPSSSAKLATSEVSWNGLASCRPSRVTIKCLSFSHSRCCSSLKQIIPVRLSVKNPGTRLIQISKYVPPSPSSKRECRVSLRWLVDRRKPAAALFGLYDFFELRLTPLTGRGCLMLLPLVTVRMGPSAKVV